MAISTIHAYLIKGEYIDASVGTVYQFANKLVDIKDYPNLGGPAEMIETTTLSEEAQKFIKGVQSRELMEFTCNYSSADFIKLANLEGVNGFQIWFGKLGEKGKFGVSGETQAWVAGADVNGVLEIKFNIYPSIACAVVTKAPELLDGSEVITEFSEWEIDLSTIDKLTAGNFYYASFDKKAFVPRLGEYFINGELITDIAWLVDTASVIELTGSSELDFLYLVEVDSTTKKVVRASKTIIE